MVRTCFLLGVSCLIEQTLLGSVNYRYEGCSKSFLLLSYLILRSVSVKQAFEFLFVLGIVY